MCVWYLFSYTDVLVTVRHIMLFK